MIGKVIVKKDTPAILPGNKSDHNVTKDKKTSDQQKSSKTELPVPIFT